ncbi:MAG: hypothetical protein E2590_18155 [Chryseobacterium sp.]|jgi:hypothetical protein|nr:hypothetical protein [Chryseobacterium sp.]
MIEDIFFQDEGQVKITAASVGISRLRWTSINETDINSNNYLDIMKKNRFDHLPIEPTNGTITEFFKTVEPNKFDKIERLQITYGDVIPLDTSIRDIIDKFADQEKTFFFLRYQKNISGLITLANLNCKQVQIYIFSLICELERELGNFLNSQLTDNKIKEWIEGKIDITNAKDKYKLIIENYHSLITSDLENQLTEHFFLVDFFKIISDKNLYREFGYTKSEWQNLGSINELRKRIAHPTRSLIDNENNIKKLQKRIKNIEDLTFRLTTRKHNIKRRLP